MAADHVHQRRLQLSAPFGTDSFGRGAERVARLFGTPYYLVGQSLLVVVWIVFNGYAILVHFDPYPFILLNLAFSTQAAYAAPLILLAQTRQADRDKLHAEADAEHRDALQRQTLERGAYLQALEEKLATLLEANTQLTEETRQLTARIEANTREMHGKICG